MGTGVATDVLTVANTLKKHYDIDVPVTVSGNYRLGDIRHNFADISKARKLLEYEPKWVFVKGFANSLNGSMLRMFRKINMNPQSRK